MIDEKAILRRFFHPRPDGPEFAFFCPGCRCAHWFKTEGGEPRWSFDGNMEKPTVWPSIKVWGKRQITVDEADRILAGEKLAIPDAVCHLFIRAGRIEFLGDCTHALKGQTVDMEPF